MKKTSILTVVGMADAVDKNGKPYKTIQVSTPTVARVETDMGLQTVFVQSRTSAFNAWEVSNLASKKGQPDFGFDLKIGDSIAGTIVKREVKTTIRDANRNVIRFDDTYEIAGADGTKRQASTYSAIILGDSSDEKSFEQAILDAFWSAGHPLKEDTRVTPKVAMLVEPKVSVTADEEIPALEVTK